MLITLEGAVNITITNTTVCLRSKFNNKIMYDIKTVESGEKHNDIVANYCQSTSSSSSSSCTSISSTIPESNMSSMPLRRRRIFQRQACLLSVMAAFSLGLALGVFIPMIGMSAAITSDFLSDRNKTASGSDETRYLESDISMYKIRQGDQNEEMNTFSVSFVKEKELPVEEVFRNAFHLEQDKVNGDTMIVKKLDAHDGSIKEFKVQRTGDGLFRKGPERRLSKPSVAEQVLSSAPNDDSGDRIPVSFVPIKKEAVPRKKRNYPPGIVKDDVYWGDVIELSLPKGFGKDEATKWNQYVNSGIVTGLEGGCGRMQNRLVIFSDGTRACARYRQNTDQIQGELFSFYLGQLLNLTNLAPSAASVIDLDTETWSSAVQDITNAQWKSSRPVVLTKWLPDLEPAGIPAPFQPLERHLNKFDVWNITLSMDVQKSQKGLLDRLGAVDDQSKRSADGAAAEQNDAGDHDIDRSINTTILNRLVELAQWSDLIVFDYLIANLDRVVNNLYNYQWNADIMAAPAHNLARQTNSQLLVFLDNESGLLHGYRLLKKYEAYHGLLLDNLCVFRRPTIEALQQLRDYGAGHQLQQLFENSTSHQVRDVLPSLPDKSIKILIDRIDRVLGQVQKCRDLFSDR